MGNNLIQKVKRGIFRIGAPLLIGGLGLINSGCSKTYEIDGNKVKYNKSNFVSWILKEETKDGNKILYYPLMVEKNRGKMVYYIDCVKINREKYTKDDTSVYNKANEHYNYLNNKIDSINNTEIQKEIQERIDLGLKAFE
jgi:hypothetical protein